MFEENYDMSWDPYSLAVEKRKIRLVIDKRITKYIKEQYTKAKMESKESLEFKMASLVSCIGGRSV